jgi:hypothetical protein
MICYDGGTLVIFPLLKYFSSFCSLFFSFVLFGDCPFDLGSIQGVCMMAVAFQSVLFLLGVLSFLSAFSFLTHLSLPASSKPKPARLPARR